MVSETHAESRVKEHAKLLLYDDRQALVFLQRDDNDSLMIVVQVWLRNSDEQLRLAINLNGMYGDVYIQNMFDALTDDLLKKALDEVGFGRTIAEYDGA